MNVSRCSFIRRVERKAICPQTGGEMQLPDKHASCLAFSLHETLEAQGMSKANGALPTKFV
jgi:hypothetical protein